jgi:hypothetical protein
MDDTTTTTCAVFSTCAVQYNYAAAVIGVDSAPISLGGIAHERTLLENTSRVAYSDGTTFASRRVVVRVGRIA